MSKRVNCFAALVCCLALLGSVVFSVARGNSGKEESNAEWAGQFWRVASLNWEPYSGAEMSTQGNVVQRLRCLLKAVDVQLLVEFYPWARAQEFAKEPEFEGYFPAWPEEVLPGFLASEPLAWSDVSVMTYAGSNVEWTDLETLFKEQYVGLIRTYAYSDAVMKLAKQYAENVTLLPSETSLLKKLSRGHISAAITDSAVMQYLAERMALGNIKFLKELKRKPLVMAFRDTPENRKRLALLNMLITDNASVSP